ncbi:hypothetical protein ZWY2020_014468 [Hordeum vulgare]|nr:hypothetical protein ZWY2020_014468 [Hordeum vulgare]
MHLSMFAVNGGHGFVGAAQCLELIGHGTGGLLLGSHNPPPVPKLLDVGVHFFQGSYWFEPYKPVDRSGGVESEAPDRETPRRVRLDSNAPPETEYYDVYHEFDVKCCTLSGTTNCRCSRRGSTTSSENARAMSPSYMASRHRMAGQQVLKDGGRGSRSLDGFFFGGPHEGWYFHSTPISP